MTSRSFLAPAFARCASAPGGVTSNALIDAIFSERPDLAGQPHVVSAQGDCAHVILFEKEVFKGPRYDDQLRQFAQEHETMNRMAAAGLPVAIVTSVGEKAHFFGQQRMKGVTLSDPLLASLGPSDREGLAQQIAAIMVTMGKALDSEDAIRLSKHQIMPTSNHLARALAHPAVREALGADIDDVGAALQSYAEESKSRKRVFMHSDLHGGNILVDQGGTRVSAVLDFGRCSYARPDLAFDCLYENYDFDFADAIAREYRAQSGQEVTYRDSALCRLAYDVMYLAGDASRRDMTPDTAKMAWRSSQVRRGVDKIEQAKTLKSGPVPRQHFLLP